MPIISGCGLTRNEAFESRFDELKTPLGNKGMQATYYNNTEMKGSPAATTDFTAPIMLSNGGNTVFAPGVNLEHFSARLDATFIPTRDETVIFNINGDDKVRLLVNGDTIVDIWRVRQRIQGAQKEIAVKAGQQYRIQIDYVQENGFAFLGFDIQHKVAPTYQELLAQIDDAETVIFVGGISPKLEGEEMRVDEEGFKGGDRTSIERCAWMRKVSRVATAPVSNYPKPSEKRWQCSIRQVRKSFSSTAPAQRWAYCQNLNPVMPSSRLGMVVS